MPDCRECGKRYRGEPPYCEPCEEYRHQVHREENPELVCSHCGRTFFAGAFNQHRWRVYYRTHEFPTTSRRRRGA